MTSSVLEPKYFRWKSICRMELSISSICSSPETVLDVIRRFAIMGERQLGLDLMSYICYSEDGVTMKRINLGNPKLCFLFSSHCDVIESVGDPSGVYSAPFMELNGSSD